MFRRLFKRNSAKPANQRATENRPPAAEPAATIPESATADELFALARTASSDKQRAAALERLDDAARVRDLAAEPDLRVLAIDRLAALDGVESAAALVREAPDREAVCLGSKSQPLKQALVEHIRAEAELQALEKSSRTRDKTVNRQVRNRLDELRGARSAALAATVEANELAASVARLDPEDAHLGERYAALAGRFDGLHKDWEAAGERLAAFAESPPDIASLPAQPQPATPEPTADEGPDFAGLRSEFDAIAEQLGAGTPSSVIGADFQALGERWRASLATGVPEAAAIEAVERCHRLFESAATAESQLESISAQVTTLLSAPPPAEVLADPANADPALLWPAADAARDASREADRLLRKAKWPADMPRPETLTLLEARREQYDTLVRASTDHRKQLEERFETAVTALEQHVQDGETRLASERRAEAQRLQDALPGGAASRTRGRFGALRGALNEMRDWQQFATDPKRDELCEAMRALADNPREPGDQAAEVKRLREQWHALGRGPKAIEERFNAAAQQAFEPCRQHFADQAALRARNLAARQAIIEQLDEFVRQPDWEVTESKALMAILQSAREEWRAAFPIERREAKALESRFAALTEQIYARVQTDRASSLEKKEALVAAAEALLTSDEPLPARLDAAKRLQADWKAAGQGPRGPEQKLWKRFRAACDTLFNTRDAEREAERSERAALSQQAAARLDAFAAALEAGPPANRTALNELRRDLREIGAADRTLDARQKTLERDFLNALDAQHREATLERIRALAELDTAVAAAELTGAQPPSEPGPEFAERTPCEPGAHRDLVLEVEWQAGVESPERDAGRRLELQVAWLNAGMKGESQPSADAQTLAARWCGMQALAGEDDLSDLRRRFFAACEQLAQRAESD
ncbi:MAG: DUF349 domain-containing protein [Pseudomonadota bacterium]